MMMNAGPFIRFRQLSRGKRRLLLRGTFILSAASAAVALLPFRKAVRFGSVPLGPRSAVSIEEIVWAVETAARRLPWRTMCIEKGLTAQRMLRWSGIEAVLHYGARHHPDSRKLEAHVWVTVDDQNVIGGEEAPNFAPIATYP
jgi:hypothetical protein